MKKHLTILLILFSSIAFANRPIIDSLTKEVQKIAIQPPSFSRDTSLIWALTYLTYNSGYFREKECQVYLDSLERITNKTSWNEGKALFLMCKSSLLFWQKQDMDNAFKNALEALKLLEKSNNNKALAWIHLRLTGLLLWQAGIIKNYEKSGLWHAQKMCEFAQKAHDNSLYCLGLAYQANHLLGKKTKNEALRALTMAENLIKQNRNIDYIAISNVYGTFAGIYSILGNHPKAMEYIDKNLSIGKPQSDYYLLSSMAQFKGEILAFHGKEKNIPLAIQFFEESHQYAKQLGDIKVQARVELFLYHAYKLNNQTSKALEYLELTKAHVDSITISNTQKIYGDYELAQKENQIKTLENEKLQSTASRQNWIRNVLILGILALIGFVFYFFRNNQKLRTKNREIEEALLKGQNIERKRVAQELHDNLSAKISGIRMRLEAIEPDFKAEKHKQIYESSVIALAEVYTDVRLISHNLLPAELETKGLYFALKNLVKELNSVEKTKFSLNVSDDLGRFSNKIEYELFSMILELSNNILKHSQAKEAIISLEKNENQLKLNIMDNGIGFVGNIESKGAGMSNLKSRVSSLSGEIYVENNAGVKVSIEVPILLN
jgi:two-component system, NarL family, sensor kinase